MVGIDGLPLSNTWGSFINVQIVLNLCKFLNRDVDLGIYFWDGVRQKSVAGCGPPNILIQGAANSDRRSRSNAMIDTRSTTAYR